MKMLRRKFILCDSYGYIKFYKSDSVGADGGRR